ncbi:MAG: FAD-dependent oxidoreductase [Planctomycetia bacterium]|nr:FAD-dependent oxidoreductase [Planctomycetia bacterium]
MSGTKTGPEHAYHVELPEADYWRRQIKCQDACPVHTDARGYVRAIADGDYRKAYLIARGPNPLASICGRICGAPCEAACRRGDYDQPIAIRALKRFASERYGAEKLVAELGVAAFKDEVVERAGSGVCEALDELQRLLRAVQSPSWKRPEGKPVAIIGAGPAGLACGHDLALMGIPSVIFEAEPVAAGMLALGVPEYRLPRDLIRAEVAVIEALGVEIRCSTEIGKDVTFDQLRQDHAAVVIAVGAKRSRKIPIPGVDGPGVLGGVDFLRDVSLAKPVQLGKRVIVVGGGNVAYDVSRTVLRQAFIDAARTAARQPDVGQVHLCCLESRAEMPADEVEVREGDEEGIIRHNGLGPARIIRDDHGKVTGVEFKRVLRVFDENRKFSPLFDENDRTTIEADTVILSVGQSTDLSFLDPEANGIKLKAPGIVQVDPHTLATTAPGVFVAGDLAHGTKLMIHAIASGKQAARSVHEYLTGHSVRPETVELHRVIDSYRREQDYEKPKRVPIPVLSAAERLASPKALVERGYDEQRAMCEASRCLDCGVNTIFDAEKCVLCGGCVDVCPTTCLKLVGADQLAGAPELGRLLEAQYGAGADLAEFSAIIKDETLCIRCANCAFRCPTGAITMERFAFSENWQ